METSTRTAERKKGQRNKYVEAYALPLLLWPSSLFIAETSRLRTETDDRCRGRLKAMLATTGAERSRLARSIDRGLSYSAAHMAAEAARQQIQSARRDAQSTGKHPFSIVK